MLLAEIGQEVLIEVDESEFSEFDQRLGLDLLSSNPNVDETEGLLDSNPDNASDDGQLIEFKEADLKSMGLPTIRAQFGITARSYSEAFAKLQGWELQSTRVNLAIAICRYSSNLKFKISSQNLLYFLQLIRFYLTETLNQSAFIKSHRINTDNKTITAKPIFNRKKQRYNH